RIGKRGVFGADGGGGGDAAFADAGEIEAQYRVAGIGEPPRKINVGPIGTRPVQQAGGEQDDARCVRSERFIGQRKHAAEPLAVTETQGAFVHAASPCSWAAASRTASGSTMISSMRARSSHPWSPVCTSMTADAGAL